MKGQPLNKNCPVCSGKLDIDTYIPGQASQEPVEVEPGDITFCFSCRTVLVVNEGFNIVMPDERLLWEISSDPDFHTFINQIDNARKNKPNLN